MADYKDVFTIIGREGKDRDGNPHKARWVRIGVCFENKDGSQNVILDANPVNGKLHIREHKDWDGDKGGNKGGNKGGGGGGGGRANDDNDVPF